jgi:hypothetical protein
MLRASATKKQQETQQPTNIGSKLLNQRRRQVTKGFESTLKTSTFKSTRPSMVGGSNYNSKISVND